MSLRRNIWSRESAFPPKFNNWLPAGEPFCAFFSRVDEFFKQPRHWNFSKKENVNLFNKGLTKAIHGDMEEAKNNFSHFRYQLESVEKAFESLDKAYFFFDDFDKFADSCLEKTFHWNEFHDYYVKGVMQRITYYKKMKTKSYSVLETPLGWPSLEEDEMAIPVEAIDTNRNILIDTGPNAKKEKIATKALENFKLAISIYDQLLDQYLIPQYKKLMAWLSRTVCWLDIKKEFQTEQDHLTDGILKAKSKVLTEKKKINVKGLIQRGKYTGSTSDLMTSAKKSIEAAQEALSTYDLVVSVHHQVMREAVLKAYQHALEVLESFTHLVSTKDWTEGKAFAERERHKAAKSVYEWINELDLFEIRNLLKSTTLTSVMIHFPDIYTCIAQFSFKYHSPY